MSILNTIIGQNSQMSDPEIANDLLMGVKSSATAYLNAILESSTPELKAIYSGNLNQVLAGHAAINELSVNHHWNNPYEKPEKQLTNVYKESVSAIDYIK